LSSSEFCHTPCDWIFDPGGMHVVMIDDSASPRDVSQINGAASLAQRGLAHGTFRVVLFRLLTLINNNSSPSVFCTLLQAVPSRPPSAQSVRLSVAVSHRKSQQHSRKTRLATASGWPAYRACSSSHLLRITTSSQQQTISPVRHHHRSLTPVPASEPANSILHHGRAPSQTRHCR